MLNNTSSAYLFHSGCSYHAHDYLGVHREKNDNKLIYSFRVWAPSAISVGLVSDFEGWETPVQLTRITDMGIWELIYCSDISLEGQAYKYRIKSCYGTVDKGDPYARLSRGGKDGSSIIFTESYFHWEDRPWLQNRRRTVKTRKGRYLSQPVNVYEMHLGSFMRREDGGYVTYRELADVLPSYLKSMGYTHVEFLPPAEHPYDGSWGYQVCAFFAPTSRFGTPDDLRYLINSLHKSGIGVIFDWVPAHFPKDEWGLYEFDGSPLYEYADKQRQESSLWGTRYFDLGRPEVQSFLISNALYYLREFHVDGLRVDAVASMIYPDCNSPNAELAPYGNGRNNNEDAVSFLKKLNSAVSAEFPDVLMIAEESTAHGGLTTPVELGGMGFSLKWNMGFANDLYDYLETDPYFRKYKHRALNFPIMYAFGENYCLPISHDEVVHGKKSFINKMYGSYEDKFKQARAALLLTMTYPGKKLLFMGCEYAQFREWDYNSSLEWFMLDYPKHREFREFVASLNHFYLAHRELWELDFSEDGFRWLLPDEEEKNTVAYQRYDTKGGFIDVFVNFSGAPQRVTVPILYGKNLESIFETGDGNTDFGITLKAIDGKLHAELELPPFIGAVMKETNKI